MDERMIFVRRLASPCARPFRVSLVAALFAIACGASTGDIPCTADTNCPTGMTCGASKLCVSSGGTDAGGSCTSPRTACPDGCDDLAADSADCGSCGHACGAGGSCSGGACVCSSPFTRCGDACVDLNRSTKDCGFCGNACPGGELCTGGICHAPPPTCPLDAVDCGGFCSDTYLDANNCGGCGIGCSATQYCYQGYCSDGACPATACNDPGGQADCTSLTLNPIDCGACARSCGPGQACISGACYDYLAVPSCSLCRGNYSTCCMTMDPTSPTVCVKGTTQCPA